MNIGSAQRAAKCEVKLMGTEAINLEEVEKETKGEKKGKKKEVVSEFVKVHIDGFCLNFI